MADVIMPKMSDAMEEGKVIKWIKQPGDTVEKGEPIAEIETDKANVELEAPDSGTLTQITTQEGDSVPIGTTIAVIGPAEEMAGVKKGAVAEAPPKEEKTAPPEVEEEKKEEAPPKPPVAEERPAPPREERIPPAIEAPPPPEGIMASPLARKIARDAGVDLRQIKGTGPAGRIVEADVRKFIETGGKPRPTEMEERPASPPREEREAPPAPARPTLPTLTGGEITLNNIWQTVGRRMTESKQQAPHFYVTLEVDMDEAIRMREMLNSVRPEGKQISINDIVVKACAAVLVKHPTINASYIEGNKIRIHDSVNIGIAVALPDGLISPVVRNCESKSLTAISDEARDLIQRTRSGEIRPEEYSGATFTVTNLGMYGVDEFSAIIVPPQAAILAVGAAIPQPTVVDGKVEIKNRMKMTVSADHRVVDGARVAEFMRDLKRTLEQPITLLE
ncbi:MAG TPA: dihydrolipoamide acetyltransferase family protein [Armatimonadota bacterium]|nr:dihydrolipoamide acetyltransferase family protein [Armatimonadota bacterium]